MNVTTAHTIAVVAHRKQVDKAGMPYIEHPARVVAEMVKAGYPDDYLMVAWLHDVVEDTEMTLEDLRGFGFTQEILDAVDAITQKKRENGAIYYARVVANPIAREVKWFDVADNASEARLGQLSPETQARLSAKYVKAREVLGGPSRPGRTDD